MQTRPPKQLKSIKFLALTTIVAASVAASGCGNDSKPTGDESHPDFKSSQYDRASDIFSDPYDIFRRYDRRREL
ncbi:MAG: hypothetical protein ACPHCI_06035, partial [Solirubrobacterales bacterium]